MSGPAIAFLSDGRLHLHKDGASNALESQFERSVQERIVSTQRRHGWKEEGRGARFAGIWGSAEPQTDLAPVTRTGLAAGPDGALFYSMETADVSGVFLLDAGGSETRLFHTAEFKIRHVALHNDGTTLAAAAFARNGMHSNIVVLPVHGVELTEVTEGDSMDCCPQWIPGPGRRIVFQSAGLGRNSAGAFVGLGPSAIHQLDLDSGALEEIAAEEGHDLMVPRLAADGTLYYIRRPYEAGVSRGFLQTLKDAVLFPFRMARALFQYFNFFSMRYTGKPLTTQKGTRLRQMDPRQLLMQANLAAAMAQPEEDEQPGTVPASWQLMRRARGGQPETIASRVLAYDMDRQGNFVYTDGVSITRLGADGGKTRILAGDRIAQVIISQ